MNILIELHNASEVPVDGEDKQVFSISGDFWIAARYKAGDWVDGGGHVVVNVVCWCELPHPANLTEIITRTFYEQGHSELSI